MQSGAYAPIYKRNVYGQSLTIKLVTHTQTLSLFSGFAFILCICRMHFAHKDIFRYCIWIYKPQQSFTEQLYMERCVPILYAAVINLVI